MPSPLTRRSFTIGAALLPAACAIQAPSPPEERSDQLDANTQLFFGGTGVACGVGIEAFLSPGSERDRVDRYGRARRLVFARMGGGGRPVYRIPLSRASVPGARTDDGSIGLESTPFAFNLAPGSYLIGWLETYDVTYAVLSGPLAGRREYGWIAEPVPPLTFDVTAGRVTYIGKVGRLIGSVSFGTAAERDLACIPRARFTNVRGNFCTFEYMVKGQDEAADLDLIRTRFPVLAERRVESAATRAPRGGWADWPAVLGDPLRHVSERHVRPTAI
jgi:hypothetical protein